MQRNHVSSNLRGRTGIWIIGFVAAIVLASSFAVAGLSTISGGGTTPGSLGRGMATPTPTAQPPSLSSTPPSVASQVPAEGAGTSTPTSATPLTLRYVPLDLPGPRPATWGSWDLPPGAPFSSATTVGSPIGGQARAAAQHLPCVAVWPANGGQNVLPNPCVGHDEPSASFYSTLPASGGNVTWNATLPQDRDAVANQSDLYAAAWFGLVVSDPTAWLGQCYIELQLYPDFNWSSPTTTVAGEWAGAIVGWQVNPTSGEVDTCYYSPLYNNGLSADGYFSMTQGDSFSVTLRGWASDLLGENVTLFDATSGVVTSQNLVNKTGGGPLDPAYATNAFLNALLWTSGGQLPISFGFEIGREGNPGGVSNSTFSGCTPGPSPSGPSDPSVPCPSYDPISWVNDTLTPWKIGTPVFFSGSQESTPSQVGFTSSLEGGDGGITNLSSGTCLNRLGSSFCTYPWFGYSCQYSSFTFGATDYATESNDFGESAEYPTAVTTNLLGLPMYAPVNFSIPTCGGTSYTVTIGTNGVSGGAVLFLSHSYPPTTPAPVVGPGPYSIQAIIPSGAWFIDWTASGQVSVASATNPSTVLRVTGSGTVTAHFSLTPPTTSVTTVWFNSTAGASAVEVSGGPFFSNGTPATTVAPGKTIALVAGTYGVQAAPSPGTTFTRWSIPSAQALAGSIAASRSPVTWLTVSGASLTLGVTATYGVTSGTVAVNLTGFGNGTVSLNAESFPYNPSTGYSSGVISPPLDAGSYVATATPAAGWSFVGWSYGGSAYLMDFNTTTNVSFEPGIANLTATFAAGIATFETPGGGGRVALNGVGPLPNGTVSPLPRGNYTLDALPFGYATFSGWVVSNSALLSIAKPNYPITHVEVNGPGTITADFTTGAANVSLTFDNSPANGGKIVFNYQNYSGATTTNTSLATGPYLVRAVPSAGWEFVPPFATTGLISVSAGILNVIGGGGVLTAHFETIGYPVSFVTGTAAAAMANISGTVLSTGQTVGLPAGTYPLSAQLGTDTSFLRWDATGYISVGNRTNATTSLTVTGAGTLFAVVDTFVLTGVTASPPRADLGMAVNFTAQVSGTAPSSFSWVGLPTGCASQSKNPLYCVPTANGSFSIEAIAYGPNDLPLTSAPLSYEVGTKPAITTFTASNTTLDLGMSTTYAAVVTGGMAPLTYAYSPLPGGCASANASTLFCQPTSTGQTRTEVSVTDLAEVVATANVTVTVFPALSPGTLTSDRSQVTVSVPFHLTAAVSGGAPPLSYVYTGLPASCTTSSQPTLTCTPGSASNYTVVVRITDAAGASVTASILVRVNPYPTVTVSVTPAEITIGAAVTFTVDASGGTGSLTYSYEGLPSGCATVNASTLICQPNATGTFTVNATVTDVLGVSATAPTIVTVNAASSPAVGSVAGVAWWIWVVVAVLIAAVVVGLYLWLRRRPPAPVKAAPEGSGSPPAP